MDAKIKVPGIKEPLPKPAVIGGLAVAGVAILWYYRKHSPSAAGAAPSTTDQYPPDGTTGNPQDLYSTDPATGMTYGDEQAGQTGFGAGLGSTDGSAFPWDGSYGNPSDPYSMDPSTGVTYGSEGSGGGSGSGGGGGGGAGSSGPPFVRNDQWARYVTNHVRVKGTAEAVGLYLNGKPLDTAQQDIIYQAIAVAGAVPVAAPGGYPPKLRQSGGGGGGHKGGKKFADNPVKGLAQQNSTGNPAEEIHIRWDKADHATGYQVSLRTETRTVHAAQTTAHAEWTFRGLKPGTHYKARVLAKPAEKGAKTAELDVKTSVKLPHH